MRLTRGIAILLVVSAGCAEPAGAPPAAARVPVYSAPVVLFVLPDSGEVQRLRQELGGDDFYVTADDAMWYQAAARTLVDSLRISHADVGRGEARFLVRGRSSPFSWKDVDRTWFLVVYDGRTKPVVVSAIDLPAHVAKLTRDAPRAARGTRR